jgi:hypothetical protein
MSIRFEHDQGRAARCTKAEVSGSIRLPNPTAADRFCGDQHEAWHCCSRLAAGCLRPIGGFQVLGERGVRKILDLLKRGEISRLGNSDDRHHTPTLDWPDRSPSRPLSDIRLHARASRISSSSWLSGPRANGRRASGSTVPNSFAPARASERLLAWPSEVS